MLQGLGARLRAARLRRRLPAGQVAERAGMSLVTLRAVERGSSSATIGAYLAVLAVLGFERDLELIAQVDALGSALQDAAATPRRARRSKSNAATANASLSVKSESPAAATPGGRTSAELAALIEQPAPKRSGTP
jgi:transcriptional regulator with XRE-family HTH domain